MKKYEFEITYEFPGIKEYIGETEHVWRGRVTLKGREELVDFLAAMFKTLRVTDIKLYPIGEKEDEDEFGPGNQGC